MTARTGECPVCHETVDLRYGTLRLHPADKGARGEGVLANCPGSRVYPMPERSEDRNA